MSNVPPDPAASPPPAPWEEQLPQPSSPYGSGFGAPPSEPSYGAGQQYGAPPSYDTAQSPYGAAQSPYGAAQSPYGTAQSPYGAQAPYGGAPQPPYGAAPPYGAQPQYGGSPYGGPGYTPVRSTNGLAIASLVLGILWLFWIGSALAVIFALVSMRQIRDSGGTQQGRGMAIAGLVLGLVGAGFLVLGIIGAATGHHCGGVGQPTC